MRTSDDLLVADEVHLRLQVEEDEDENALQQKSAFEAGLPDLFGPTYQNDI
jgi:hypothetical protein